MNLSNLKPAEGSTKSKKELVVVPVRVWAEPLPEVIKEPNRDRATKRKSVSKVVRCLCNVVCLNSDSKISIA